MFLRLQKFYKTNTDFLSLFVRLMIPITLQNILGYGLNMADTVMLGSLGELEISATSLANTPFTLFWCIIFGLGSGASIMIAQYWGKRDIKSINSIAGFISLISAAFGLIFTVVLSFFPVQVMRLFSSEAAVIEMGAQYLSIVGWSYVITGISTILLTLIRCTEQAKMPLYVSCVALTINTVLNYIFIFGKLGVPAMGVRGAAYATLIARIAEVIITVWFVLFGDSRRIFKIRRMCVFNGRLIMDTIKYTTTTLLNDGLWGIGIAFHPIIMGHLGVSVMAAYSTAGLIERFCFIVVGGIGASAAVIIGKELGSGRLEEAYRYSKFILGFAVFTFAVFTVAGYLLFPVFISFFDYLPETVLMTRNIVYVMLLVFICKTINYNIGIGFLRSGGDATFVMLSDIICLYTLSIPLGWIAAFVLGFPPHLVYLFLMSDEIIKFIFCYPGRWKSKKWVKNITRNFENT